MNKLIAIAGGSGSGKSTLATALCKKNSEWFSLVHVDDYYKESKDVPRKGDYINWDHPDSLRFDDLLRDLQALLNGESIQVETKSELYYPEYDPKNPQRITKIIEPRKIVILEGYLSLYDERIRSLVNFSIYLDMNIKESMLRRSKNKGIQDQEYYEKILIPAHKEFVEATKHFANYVLDVSGINEDKVYAEVCEELRVKFPNK